MRILIAIILVTLPMLAQVPAVPDPTTVVPMQGRIAPQGNFPLLNGGSVTMPANADYTLAYPQFTGSVLQILSAVPLTVTRNVIHNLPANQAQRFGFEFTVQNLTSGGRDIVFKGSTGAGVTIPNGETRIVMFDGTNYVPVSSGSVGAGPGAHEVIFNGVSDARKDETCSTTAGSQDLTCSDAPFSPCPTDKLVDVTGGVLEHFTNPQYGAMTQQESLITTIQSCNSASVAVMARAATNTITNTAARWGTDNGPALIALANAPSTAGKIFRIPPGNYIVRTTEGEPSSGYGTGPGHAIDVYSNTTYHIMHGAHIYWIGPRGCTGWDPGCTDPNYPYFVHPNHLIEQGIRFFYLHDHDYWTQTGTHNVHIIVDGIFEGSNTKGGPGMPMLNQSAFAFWVGIYGGKHTVTDVTVDGTGELLNLYGFAIHGISGIGMHVRGLKFTRVAKGLNVNGYISDQSNNTFTDGAGIEACGMNITVIGNRFSNTWGISVGGIGQGTECNGYVVANNVFDAMHATNLDLSQCPVGAIVANNSFDVPPRRGVPPYDTPTAFSLHDDTPNDATATRDNLIIGNTFVAEQGDGSDWLPCYAAISSGGSANGGNVFVNNKMTNACLFGYLMYSHLATNPAKPNVIQGDTIWSQNADILTQADTNLELRGPMMGNGAIGGAGPSRLTPNSWWMTPAGGVQFGKLTIVQPESAGTRGAIPATQQHKTTPPPKTKPPNPKPKYLIDPLELYQNNTLADPHPLALYVSEETAEPQAPKTKPPTNKKETPAESLAPASAPPAYSPVNPLRIQQNYPKPLFIQGQPPPQRSVAKPPEFKRLPTPRNMSHTSAFRILSPDHANYLDFNVPNAGNPSITSSTGGITVSGLTGGAGDGAGFSAGGDLAGSATSQQVTGIRGTPVPALANGYLRFNNGQFSFDTPVGGSGGIQSINGNASSAQTIVGSGAAQVNTSVAGQTTIYVPATSGDGGISIPQSAGVLFVKSGGGQPPPGGNTQYFGVTEIGPHVQDLEPTAMVLTAIPYAPADATVNSCSVYVGATATGRVYCFLYDSSGGYPHTLLCGDTTGTVVTANSWNTITSFQAGSCPPLVAANKYFMGIFASDTVTLHSYQDPTPYHFYTTTAVPCCTPPNPMPQEELVLYDAARSVFLTVTVSDNTRNLGRQALAPRSGYTLGTTIGTGYLHYDGAHYAWDMPSLQPAGTHAAGSIACFKSDGTLGSCHSAFSGDPPTCTCQ